MRLLHIGLPHHLPRSNYNAIAALRKSGTSSTTSNIKMWASKRLMGIDQNGRTGTTNSDFSRAYAGVLNRNKCSISYLH